MAAAVDCPRAIEELAQLYAELAETQDGSDRHCFGGGTCCRFGAYGHRLYVTALELAALLRERPVDSSRPARMLCAYQQGPLCRARTWRPLGCRTYFCQGDPQAQSGIHERFHQRLTNIHKRFDLPYLYCELTAALEVLAENAGAARELD